MKALSKTKKWNSPVAHHVDSDGEELYEEQKEYLMRAARRKVLQTVSFMSEDSDSGETSSLGKSNGHERRKVVVAFSDKEQNPPKNCCLKKINLKPIKIYKMIKTSHDRGKEVWISVFPVFIWI